MFMVMVMVTDTDTDTAMVMDTLIITKNRASLKECLVKLI